MGDLGKECILLQKVNFRGQKKNTSFLSGSAALGLGGQPAARRAATDASVVPWPPLTRNSLYSVVFAVC